jgi:predicted DNA-binding transcriptional regulator AlpA
MYDKFETIPELAERWKVHVSWVYGKTRETGPDAIPRIRVGKYIRFIPQAVDAWLEKQNQKAAA